MRLLPNVRFHRSDTDAHLQAVMVAALLLVEPLFKAERVDLVVTAALDGVHMAKSLHYQGLAVDLRSKHLQDDITRSRVLAGMRQALTMEYQILFENPGTVNEHYHIEFDPQV